MRLMAESGPKDTQGGRQQVRFVSSYRSGIDARDPRPQSRTALWGVAVLGMLAPVGLGCTSTNPGMTAAAAPAVGLATAAESKEGEDPRLAAAFARLEQVRAEREQQSAARVIAARPNLQTGTLQTGTLRTGTLQTGPPPASEMLPGASAASIPVWPRIR